MRTPLALQAVLIAAVAMPCMAGDVVNIPADADSLVDAIAQVTDGGVIELEAGTYPTPVGGWFFGNLQKSFTIRAAGGATVTLDGGGVRPVLRIHNTSAALGRQITFQGLIFANGRSTEDGVGGGVTLEANDAVFTDCEFRNNGSDAWVTGGGGVMAFDESEVQFIGCRFESNWATNEGGGLKIGSDSRAVIHDTVFIDNRVNLAGHRGSSAGGAIHVGNADLMVSNTRFEGNEAGYVGGAVYVIGSWQAPVSVPRSVVKIANSTFVDNVAEPFPGVTPPGSTEGGAFHIEDQARARIDFGRFLTNSAENGGGLNLYRAEVELRNSVFRGNQATAVGAGTGFGGAIAAISNDTSSDGSNNRPAAVLTIRDTLIQGVYQMVENSAQIAGGLFASGDQNRQYGQNGVPAAPDFAANRAEVDLDRVVFSDCIVTQTVSGTGRAGGLNFGLSAVEMDDSLVLASAAIGVNSQGGGMRVIGESLATIATSTFAGNEARRFGGAIYIQGAEIQLDQCALIENTNGDDEFGAAIFGAPDEATGVTVTGEIADSVISNTNDGGLLIFDDDRSTTPYNDLRYNGNTIHDQSQGADVYRDSQTGAAMDVDGLNSLVVNRASAPSTDKSTIDNTDPGNAPKAAAILAVPTKVLPQGAADDPVGATDAFVGYAWTGGSATLDGSPVSGFTGLDEAGVGTHVLNVVGTQDSAVIGSGVIPEATFAAVPSSISSGQQSELQWATTAGSFLAAVLDNGVVIPSTPSGSVVVSPAVTTTYHLFVLTQEGGVSVEATVWVDEEPGMIFADDFETGDTGAWDSTNP